MRISKHVDFGKQGEQLAVEFLKSEGYKILDTNYRNAMGELDIIARKDQLLVIIEVKRRKTIAHGFPREAVSYHKQKQIARLTQWYIQQHKLHNMQVRFDVIEIIGEDIHHIKDAFRVG